MDRKQSSGYINNSRSNCLLGSVHEQRNQQFEDYGIDSKQGKINPRILESLDKIDNIKMQVLELKRQIDKIDLCRAELACVDKIRSLSGRKAQREASLKKNNPEMHLK